MVEEAIELEDAQQGNFWMSRAAVAQFPGKFRVQARHNNLKTSIIIHHKKHKKTQYGVQNDLSGFVIHFIYLPETPPSVFQLSNFFIPRPTTHLPAPANLGLPKSGHQPGHRPSYLAFGMVIIRHHRLSHTLSRSLVPFLPTPVMLLHAQPIPQVSRQRRTHPSAPPRTHQF